MFKIWIQLALVTFTLENSKGGSQGLASRLQRHLLVSAGLQWERGLEPPYFLWREASCLMSASVSRKWQTTQNIGLHFPVHTWKWKWQSWLAHQGLKSSLILQGSTRWLSRKGHLMPTRSDPLSSVPESHMINGDNRLPAAVLRLTRTCTRTHTCHTQMFKLFKCLDWFHNTYHCQTMGTRRHYFPKSILK